MGPDVDQFVVRIKQRPEARVEAAQLAPIAPFDERIHLHPSGEIIDMQDALRDRG